MRKLLLSCLIAAAFCSQAFAQTATVPSTTNNSRLAFVPVYSAAAESSHVLKNSAGMLYGLYITAPSAAAYIMVFNSATVPSDGSVLPIDCVYAPSGLTTFISFLSGPPEYFSTGISVAISSTGCFSKTTSPTTFFHALVY